MSKIIITMIAITSSTLARHSSLAGTIKIATRHPVRNITLAREL